MYSRKERSNIFTFMIRFAAVLLLMGICTIPSKAAAGTTSTTITIKGKTYKYVKNVSGETETDTLYKVTSSGNKKVASKKCSSYASLSYICTYGNKIYFNYVNDSGGSMRLYTYTVGAKGFKKINNLNVSYVDGKYAFGYTSHATDVGGSKLCLYNFAKNKVTALGKGYVATNSDGSLKLINGKIYYAKMSSDYKTCKIYSISLNGKKKKLISTFKDSRQIFSVFVYENYCKYADGSTWSYHTVTY